MSKSIEVYYDLKLHQGENNSENTDLTKLVYLFKVGVFYLFFNNDAIKFSPILNLQLIKYGTNAVDCGFPMGALGKYTKMLKDLGYNFRIVRLKDSKVTNNPYCVYKTNFLDIGDEDTLTANEIEFVGELKNYDDYVKEAQLPKIKMMRKEEPIINIGNQSNITNTANKNNIANIANESNITNTANENNITDIANENNIADIANKSNK